MIKRKRRGEKIHTSEAILTSTQRSLIRGEHVEWTCMAGYKLFFPRRDAAAWCIKAHHGDVTLDDLYGTQEIVPERLWCLLCSECFAVERPAQVLSCTRQAHSVNGCQTPNTDKAPHSTITNPDGTHEMNGRTESGHSCM